MKKKNKKWKKDWNKRYKEKNNLISQKKQENIPEEEIKTFGFIGGLKETPKEKQKYSFGGVFGYPDISELPNEYSIGNPLEIKNQNIPSQSYICVAEALCSVSEYQEGVKLEPAYTIKIISEILGDTKWLNEGTDLATGAKASLRGFLERENSPYSVETNGVEFCANSANWDASLNDLAMKHAKQAWFWIK